MAEIEERLVFDIGSALSSIDELDATLSQTSQHFKGSLADALTVLDNVQIEDVDTTAVETELQTLSDTPLTLEADADTSAAANQLALFSAEPYTVDIAADTADASQQLTLFTEDINDALGKLSNTSSETADDITSSIGGALGGIGSEDTEGLDEVTEQIGEMGSESKESGQGLATLSNSMTSLGGVSTIATGGLGNIVASLSNLTAGQLKAGGAVIGTVVAIDQLASAGSKLTKSQALVNTRFGEFSAQLETINVGSLNTSLEDLATSFAITPTAINNTVASLGSFGTSLGLNQQQAARFSEETLALSAGVIGLNPQLGSLDTVTTRLQTAFLRGGITLNRLGINLDETEVRVRAMENAQKGLGDGTSRTSLAIARQQLAVEQYGPELGKLAEQGSAAQSSVAKAAAEFQAAFAKLGQNLSSSVGAIKVAFIDLGVVALKTLTPAIQAAAETLGGFILAVESTISVVKAAIPEVTGFFKSLELDDLAIGIAAVAALGGTALVAAGSLGLLSGAMAVATGAIQTLTIAMLLNPSVTFAAGAIAVGVALNKLGPAALLAIPPLVALGLALNANPYLIAAAAIGLVFSQLDELAELTQNVDFGAFADGPLAGILALKNGVSEARVEIDTTIDSVEGVTASVTGFGDASTDAAQDVLTVRDAIVSLFESGEDLKASNLQKVIEGTGQSLEEATSAALKGGDGYRKLQAEIAAANGVTIELNGQTVDLAAAISTGAVTTQQARGALNAWGGEAKKQSQGLDFLRVSAMAASNAALEQAVSTGVLTQAQADNIRETNSALPGMKDWEMQLLEIATATDMAAEKIEKARLGTILLNPATASLTQEMLAGKITTEDFITGMGELGVTFTEAAGLAETLRAKTAEMTAEFQNSLPKATDAIDSLETASDPTKILENFQAIIDEMSQFSANITAIIDEDSPALSQFLYDLNAEQGTGAANAFAGAYLAADDETQAAIQANLETIMSQQTTLAQKFATDMAPILVATFVGIGAALAEQFGIAFDPVKATSDALNGVPGAVEEATPASKIATYEMGTEMTTGLTDGTTNVPTATDGAFGGLVRRIGEHAVNSAAHAVVAGQGITSGVTTGTDGVKSAADAGFANLLVQMQALAATNSTEAITLGQAIVDGLASGIDANAGNATRAARDVANEVMDIIRDAIDPGSPSKVTTVWGKAIGDGLAVGINSTLQSVTRASESLAVAAMPSITDAVASDAIQSAKNFSLMQAKIGAGSSTTNQSAMTNMINVNVDASVTPENAFSIGELVGDGVATAMARNEAQLQVRTGAT